MNVKTAGNPLQPLTDGQYRAYHRAIPGRVGLYDPSNEKDACGVGFIAQLKGRQSHDIIADALVMLQRMDHRGACGCESNTGDGAGILTSLPDPMLRRVAADSFEAELPPPGLYGVGMIFMPRSESLRENCRQIMNRFVEEQGLKLLGWRRVPTDAAAADVGPSALATEPVVEQIFIGADENTDQAKFERRLYTIRKQAYHKIMKGPAEQTEMYYVCSMSSRVIVYKGQLKSGQVPLYYPDLVDSDYVSHLAMVHSRFSTNTFPSWARAQPMRWMSHNGEINTLRGNVNWMIARQGLMRSLPEGGFSTENLGRLMPVIDPITSDSGMFDNVLEFLLLAGRSLPEAIMLMIPEAWENHELMSVAKRAFYEFHANLMEPWDGPASVAFTDGKYIGAVLDRNGLRPSRYYLTDDDRVIMASEVGVLNIDPSRVVAKGRLQPGRMFLVDFDKGRIVADEEIKNDIATRRPYGQWLQRQRMEITEIPAVEKGRLPQIDRKRMLPLLQMFGYTTEHLTELVLPMAKTGKEALGSMGNDAALAVLSDKPRLVYDYFKQLFAQVTNPPIDPIREEIIMSLETYIGPEGNLLDTCPNQCHRLHLNQPVLLNDELAAIKHMNYRDWQAKVIDITYPRSDNETRNADNLIAALDHICDEASDAVWNGYQVIVLTDRHAGPDRIPISSLVATGAVHHRLVKNFDRTKVGLVIESGEVREVHHFCTLIGYGADAVNPYLAFESLLWMRDQGMIDGDMNDEKIINNYIKAVGKGILKVMSKMGISTLASYKGAQIFESVGLSQGVIDRCFTGTADRLQGVGFNVLAREGYRRHEIAYPRRARSLPAQLQNPGEYHWRAEGEQHAVTPQSIMNLQMAARTNNRERYDQYARLCNGDARQRCTLRGLLRIQSDPAGAIDLDQVEPAKEIVKRIRTGAMSLGSLSREAHETLAVAMNRLGGRSNSGEGGEDPVRFNVMENGDSRRSSIKQIASGRFGVTSWYLANADVLQIKMAQGAKPGEGGQLPGHKVDRYIAQIRYSTPGVGLISPPPHHDIYSIEDLAQLIFDLKNANPKAMVSVKLVSEVGVGTVAAGVAKAHADHILISGHDGGTGASPLTSIKHAGLPWELGLAETHQTLVLNDLRSRVRLETDGGIRTGRDMFIAACLGAEEYGMSTAPLISIGCIMMRKCHLNTCPVGICSQDPELRRKFQGRPEHLINFLFMVAEEARTYMAMLGIRRWDDLIGRVDILDHQDAIDHWKADSLDLSPVLMPAVKPHDGVGTIKSMEQDHGLDKVLDNKLIELADPALESRTRVVIDLPVHNVDRAVGTMLSHEVSSRCGESGLPDDTIMVQLNGSAGQSLGAWLSKGITIRLEGDANDYVGKGLSGGRLMIYPPRQSRFSPEENVIIGNVALYGATGGEAYIRGVAAERFAVRNSGAYAVIEGVGDHGCEYMTGGRVVVLGPTGRNFAAGMSGGIAYIWDKHGNLLQHCNLGMVDLERLTDPDDVDQVKQMIRRHLEYTGSTVAAHVLAEWDRLVSQFVKVMPIDYRRVLAQHKHEQSAARESTADRQEVN